MAVSKTDATAPASSERKTVTNWGVFDKAGLVPTRVTCNGYLGQHPADMSCHSNILVTSESIKRHMDPNHGGGWFFVRLRVTDAKGKNPIWRELQEGGVEIQHLYCPHCRTDVDMTPRAMMYHLQPHPGANRVNQYPQSLCMSLGYNQPEGEEFQDEVFE